MELNVMKFSINNPIGIALILQTINQCEKFVAEWQNENKTLTIIIYANEFEKNKISQQLSELNPIINKCFANTWSIKFLQSPNVVYEKITSLGYKFNYIE